MRTGIILGLAGLVVLGLAGVSRTVSTPGAPLASLIPQEVTGKRRELLLTAISELGHVGGNKYWADAQPAFVGTSEDWCGGFVLWALHQVGLARDRGWIIGVGFILAPPFDLPTTNDPKPGDIIYIDQPNQHQGMVLRIEGNTIHTIDGNSGNIVTINDRQRSSITAFFSIEPLIQQGIA
jgi:hypothetical protein